MSLIEQIFIRN